MIVICVKNTKKLVKGLRYEAQGLWNSGKNQRWLEGKVEIKNFGRFVVSNFTDSNGNPLPQIDILPPTRTFTQIKFEDLKVGDIIVCTSDSYKTLVKNGMYKIEKLEDISTTRTGFNGQKYNCSEKSIKFEGIKRKLKFSSWRFRCLTPQETREISLLSLLDNQNPNIIKSSDIKKIDLVVNKDLELMKIIAKSIIDENRHHLNIVEWACAKSSGTYNLTEEDFSSLLKMNLGEILEKIKTS